MTRLLEIGKAHLKVIDEYLLLIYNHQDRLIHSSYKFDNQEIMKILLDEGWVRYVKKSDGELFYILSAKAIKVIEIHGGIQLYIESLHFQNENLRLTREALEQSQIHNEKSLNQSDMHNQKTLRASKRFLIFFIIFQVIFLFIQGLDIVFKTCGLY